MIPTKKLGDTKEKQKERKKIFSTSLLLYIFYNNPSSPLFPAHFPLATL